MAPSERGLPNRPRRTHRNVSGARKAYLEKNPSQCGEALATGQLKVKTSCQWSARGVFYSRALRVAVQTKISVTPFMKRCPLPSQQGLEFSGCTSSRHISPCAGPSTSAQTGRKLPPLQRQPQNRWHLTMPRAKPSFRSEHERNHIGEFLSTERQDAANRELSDKSEVEEARAGLRIVRRLPGAFNKAPHIADASLVDPVLEKGGMLILRCPGAHLPRTNRPAPAAGSARTRAPPAGSGSR